MDDLPRRWLAIYGSWRRAAAGCAGPGTCSAARAIRTRRARLEFQLDTAGPAGDCAVLRVTGEVDVYTAPLLREQIQKLAAGGAVHLPR